MAPLSGPSRWAAFRDAAGRRRLIARTNARLDRWARPTVLLGRRSWSSFFVLTCLGIVVATGSCIAVFGRHGRSPGVLVAIALACVASSLLVVYVTRVITGKDYIVFYHHLAADLLATCIVVALLGRPLLPYLDVAVLAIGLTLSFVRAGCLMVGCCHGRPARVGVRYGARHTDAGFAPWYVGVRLLPVQALESVGTLVLALAGIVLALGHRRPGSALVFFVLTYALLRFGLERLRADERPTAGGLSHAQWFSLALVGLVLAASAGGLLPGSWWELMPAGILLAAVWASRWGRRRIGEQLTSPRFFEPAHLREMATAVQDLVGEGLAEPEGTIRASRTSLGLVISATGVRSQAGDFLSVSFSLSDRQFPPRVAARLRALLPETAGSADGRLLTSPDGAVHVITPLAADLACPKGQPTLPDVVASASFFPTPSPGDDQ